jgi:hypothetical protein
MLTEAFAVPPKCARHNSLTLASMGAIACIAADIVHEALGHGIASWITGDRIVSLSTVAIQNVSANRFVSAAGTAANCIVGVFSLLALRRMRKLTPTTYFLWIFGAFNLLNVGYLFTSAALNSGDWANVIFGLYPPWLWQYFLGLAGVALYVLAVLWLSGFLTERADEGEIAAGDVWRFVWPAYLAAGAVMTIASTLNPISPTLILLSGVGASFGLNAGLLFVPAMVTRNVHGSSGVTRPIPFSLLWFTVAMVVSGLFIGVLGPGIYFWN